MYEATRIDVRGTRVDVAGSIRGLYELSAATTLELSLRHEQPRWALRSGTEVAILGTAAGGDYFYVSPCNACDSGFAPRAALKIP